MKAMTTTLRVRIGDINYAGHLGHDHLITLLHQARCDFLLTLGFSELRCGNSALIMRHIEVNYLAEAFLGDILECSISVKQIRTASFTLYYRLTREETLIATATTQMVCFDYTQHKICALAPDVAAKLTEALHE